MAFKRRDYDRLMGHIDIINIISKYVELKPRSRSTTYEYLGLCPFHGEDHPSFSVTRQKQFYHCHGCGATGSAVTFLMNFCGLSGGKALIQAAEMCGLKVPQGPSSPSSKKLRDRKKFKRKTEHRRNVVWNRERNARRSLQPTNVPLANSLFSDEWEDEIPF